VPRKPEIEQEKKEEKKCHHPWIQLWSLSWLSGSSCGGRAPGGQGVLVVGARSKGLAPSPFIPFRCLSHSFLKVLKNESVGMGAGGSWWSHMLNLLSYMT